MTRDTAREVPATTGTLFHRMLAGIRLSERARTRATRRAECVRSATIAETLRRDKQTHRTTPRVHLDTIAAQHADSDHVVLAEIGSEQWGCRLGTMYGIASCASSAQDATAQLQEIHTELRRTNALLTQLIDHCTNHTT